MENDIKQAISFLVLLLQKEKNSGSALQYSQAALNLAHVLKNLDTK